MFACEVAVATADKREARRSQGPFVLAELGGLLAWCYCARRRLELTTLYPPRGLGILGRPCCDLINLAPARLMCGCASAPCDSACVVSIGGPVNMRASDLPPMQQPNNSTVSKNGQSQNTICKIRCLCAPHSESLGVSVSCSIQPSAEKGNRNRDHGNFTFIPETASAGSSFLPSAPISTVTL